MATLSATRTDIRTWLGTTGDLLDATIDQAINDVIHEITAKYDTPYNYVVDAETSTTNPTFAPTALSTVAGTRRYDLPTGFGRPLRASVLSASDSVSRVPLIFVSSREEWGDLFPDPSNSASRGAPTHWAIFDDKIHIGPTPDAVYTIYREYYRIIPAISSASDELEIMRDWPQLIRWGALSQLSVFIFEDTRVEMFFNKYRQELADFLRVTKDRTTQARRPVSRSYGAIRPTESTLV
jgi:hypothetical protein